MFSLGSVARLSTSSEKPVRSPLMLFSCGLISVSGFGYSFHSLPRPGTDPRSADKTDNELARALADIFFTERRFSVLSILVVWFPFLKRLVRRSLQSKMPFECSCTFVHALQRPESRSIQKARAIMQRIGTHLINERKVAPSEDVPKSDTSIPRDILSVLGT